MKHHKTNRQLQLFKIHTKQIFSIYSKKHIIGITKRLQKLKDRRALVFGRNLNRGYRNGRIVIFP